MPLEVATPNSLSSHDLKLNQRMTETTESENGY